MLHVLLYSHTPQKQHFQYSAYHLSNSKVAMSSSPPELQPDPDGRQLQLMVAACLCAVFVAHGLILSALPAVYGKILSLVNASRALTAVRNAQRRDDERLLAELESFESNAGRTLPQRSPARAGPARLVPARAADSLRAAQLPAARGKFSSNRVVHEAEQIQKYKLDSGREDSKMETLSRTSATAHSPLHRRVGNPGASQAHVVNKLITGPCSREALRAAQDLEFLVSEQNDLQKAKERGPASEVIGGESNLSVIGIEPEVSRVASIGRLNVITSLCRTEKGSLILYFGFTVTKALMKPGL